MAELEPLLLTDAVKAGLVRLGAQHVRGLKLLQVKSSRFCAQIADDDITAELSVRVKPLR